MRVTRFWVGAIGLPFVVFLLWAQSLFSLRFPLQHDLIIHLQWAKQFHESLLEGNLFPHWTYASFEGLGAPTFFYYQPLFYYISSFFSLLGLGTVRSVLFAATTPYLILGIILYTHLSRHYSNLASFFGTAFLIACPALYFISFQMAFFPWTMSLPFAILFVMESIRERPRFHFLAAFLCLTCLSHLLTGLMVLCSTTLATLFLAARSDVDLSSRSKWALGVLLGLGLSAFFIYPAITQLPLISPEGWTDSRVFNWKKSMFFPIVTRFLFGSYWGTLQWVLPSFSLLMVTIVLLDKSRRNQKIGQRYAFRLAVTALSSLLLGSELAYPLYAYLSPMQKIQFPVRFVLLATILSGLAFVIHLLEGAWANWNKPRRCAALTIIAMYLSHSIYLQVDVFHSSKLIPSPAEFMKGRFGQPEYLVSSRGPDWESYLDKGSFSSECRKLSIFCEEIGKKKTHDRVFLIQATKETIVRLPIFSFPAWKTYIDGQPYNFVADSSTGLISINLPAGNHIVRLNWSRLSAEITGIVISIISAFIILLTMLAPFLNQKYFYYKIKNVNN